MLSRLGMVASILLVAAMSGASASVTYWKSTDGVEHWYEVVQALDQNGAVTGITWQAASQAASAKHGYLATLTSQDENDVVVGLIGSSDPDSPLWKRMSTWSTESGPWLGGYQTPPVPEANYAANWHWVTGEPWVYTNWSKPFDTSMWLQPDNGYGGENWLQFSRVRPAEWASLGVTNTAPQWNDSDGASELTLANSFVVEYDSAPPVPQLAPLALLSGGALPFGVRRLLRRSPRASRG